MDDLQIEGGGVVLGRRLQVKVQAQYIFSLFLGT